MLFLIAVLSSLLIPMGTIVPSHAQEISSEAEKAQLLLESLSPEEKVGQLFLVTFPGMNVDEDSRIFDLIVNRHIGGVVLLAGNDNFSTGETDLRDILTMNRQLQNHRWNATQDSSLAGVDSPQHFIPLFIATDFEANDYPNEQFIDGLTPLPNQMAIGATWNPELSFQIGNVVGQELSALGINLLLNPSLDVLETPRPSSPSDLGTRTFGGDPFWVGEMGRAYVSGVHQGSNNQIAVIAKHFPGNGGADRLPDEEVATVRKSLDQLKKYDLAPFYAVTGNATSPENTVEGLLTSHIRYQGFQENIRATTRPVSFDPQAFTQLMSLPPLATWREAGGLMISDNLGSEAVNRFYELTGQTYEARRVATNAFLAGNDLLYLGNITSEDEPDSYTAIVRTLDFFAQKYQEDPAFAQRVDESTLRILTLKYRLYPNFNLPNTLPPLEGINQIGQANQITFDVAQKAATLISPSIAELTDAIPDPPNQNDRIVFISDSRMAQYCSECSEQTILEPEDFRQAVLQLYGPQAAGLALPYNLSAFSYQELAVMLDSEEPETLQIESDLRRSHWIVFAILNVTQDVPLSQTFHRFLAERPDLIQGRRLIVFAFNAPYYLDATNISKITTYYGLYSQAPSFTDVAARLLYRELQPSGALPVSVPGVGYDLIAATSPDPAQVIPLLLDLPSQEIPQTPSTQEPIPTPEYRLGDLISLKTGVILDHNGNPVPDNTPVNFIFTSGGEITALPLIEMTKNGVAQATIQVTQPGGLEIRVESEPAKQSEILRFDIPAENGLLLTDTPAPEPTATPSPSPTVTIAPLLAPSTPQPQPPDRPNLLDWFMATLVVSIIAFIAYRSAALIGQGRWGVRGGFLAIIGGLLAYSYLALSLPGSESLLSDYGAWGVIGTVFIGALIGILAVIGWRTIQLSTSN